MRNIILCAAVAAAAISSVAIAAVTFDPGTGTGFVGKGDVQLVYGWNDAALQRKAAGVSFSYSAEETYSYDCTYTIITGRDRVASPQTVTRGKDYSVSASIAYDTRKNNQNKITGFNLTGMTLTGTTGDAPVDGGYCSGGPLNDGTISNVQLLGTTGGLFVNHTEGTYQIG